MKGLCFVDTNILLYSLSTSPSETEKRDRARDLLDSEQLALSVQVLQEFYVQATRASRVERITHFQACELMATWTRFTVQDNTLAVLNGALDLKERFGLSFWDSAIVSAARVLDCRVLYSEDMNHGQEIGKIRIVNPFL